MIYRGMACLLLGALAWGQAANSSSAPAPQASETQSSSAAAKPAETKVAPDAVVMTIPGLCDSPSDKPKPADCKTTVTRAEFETVMNTVAPTMPPAARKQFATRYAMGLVMSQEAHQMGLDKGQRYEEMVKIAQMQVLMQLLGDNLREKAGQIPEKDIDDYYKNNLANYEEIGLQRLVIPHSRQLEASKIKLTPAQTKKRQDDADAAMKTEAATLRARAAAGESFSKLQGEAFQFAGIKSKPPSTDMGKVRKGSVPAAHASIFELKPGAVSQLFNDPSGFYVYKVGARETLTLDQVKEEIQNALRGQRMQESMQAMQKMATPVFDDNYFGPPATPAENKPPSAPASPEHK
jgi:hypothetical protein